MSLLFSTGAYLSTNLRAGIVYGSSMFVTGFVCGTVRVLLLEPKLEPLVAVCLEFPIMMRLSWWLSHSPNSYLMKHEQDSSTTKKDTPYNSASFMSMLLLPASALTTLLMLETFMSVLLLGRTLDATIRGMLFTQPGQLGLIAQVICSYFPMFGRKEEPSRKK